MRQSFEQLIQMAQQGDRSALSELLERVYPRVRSLVHRKLIRKRHQRALRILSLYSTGDFVQEVFMKIVTRIDSFNGRDEDTLVNYVAALARNTIIDTMRYVGADRRKTSPRRTTGPDCAALEGGGASPLDRISADEAVDTYREVLSTFGDREGELLRLRIEERAPFAGLAKQLRFPSEDAARKAFHAAHATLLVRLRMRGIRA